LRTERGQWVCKQCGAHLEVPEGQRPDVMIAAASGQPNMRILSIDGREIHRCVIS
jgi:hypothetical protein